MTYSINCQLAFKCEIKHLNIAVSSMLKLAVARMV